MVSVSPVIGLLGGGQLGRMMIQAAHRLGLQVVVLDPDPKGPAAQIADDVVVGHYADQAALTALAERAQVFTTEFENIPSASLRFLAQHGPTYPDAASVELAQDRRKEKTLFAKAGIPVGPYITLNSPSDFEIVKRSHFPAILKTAELGYDGKGQLTVTSLDELSHAFQELGSVPCVLEKKLSLKAEISVVIARNAQGHVAVFPSAQNKHRNGILHTSDVPVTLPQQVVQQAEHYVKTLALKLGYVGVLALEFFWVEDLGLLANEMAPRPHNSGHYTMDACPTSQFEQQARICAHIPLGPTRLQFACRMTNLLGDLWFPDGPNKPMREPDWTKLVPPSNAWLHLYGKTEPRPGRKMGHITQKLGDA